MIGTKKWRSDAITKTVVGSEVERDEFQERTVELSEIIQEYE